MLLHGSCHCGAVSYSVETRHPYPFNVCYCKICRKTGGGGGFGINLGAEFSTLKIDGEEHVKSYNAKIKRSGEVTVSPSERKFCGHCGSSLWVWDPRWPELVHPHASAIDTDLPVPPEKTHLMLACKASWVEPALGKRDRSFEGYPDESIADWHQRLRLTD